MLIEGFLGDKDSLLLDFEFQEILDILLPFEIIRFIDRNYEGFSFKKEILDKEGAFLPPGCRGNEGNSKAKIEIYPKIFFFKNQLNFSKFYFAIGHLVAHGIKEPQDIPLIRALPVITEHAFKREGEEKQREIWADFLAFCFLNQLLAQKMCPEVFQIYCESLNRLPEIKSLPSVSEGQEGVIDTEFLPKLINLSKSPLKIPQLSEFLGFPLIEKTQRILRRLKAQGII